MFRFPILFDNLVVGAGGSTDPSPQTDALALPRRALAFCLSVPPCPASDDVGDVIVLTEDSLSLVSSEESVAGGGVAEAGGTAPPLGLELRRGLRAPPRGARRGTAESVTARHCGECNG